MRDKFGWLMLLGVSGGVLAGFLIIGFKRGGVLTLSNVGALPEIAPVQEALRPLDACKIAYAQPDSRGARRHFDAVFAQSCSSPDTVVVKVPPRKGVSFLMERSSREAPFAVMVPKEEVAYSDLVAALTEFTPLFAEYERSLGAERVRRETSERGLEEWRRTQEEVRERAKKSYPAQ